MAGVGFRERCVKGERLANHSERVGAVVFVGDTVAEAHVRHSARQCERCHSLARQWRKGDGDIIVSNGRFRAETELRIIAVDSSVVDFEVLGQRKGVSRFFVSDGDVGRDGIVSYFYRSILQYLVCVRVLVTECGGNVCDARSVEGRHVERRIVLIMVIRSVIGNEGHRDLSVGEAAGVVAASFGAGSGYRVAAGVGGKRERVAGVSRVFHLDFVGDDDGAINKTERSRRLTAAGKHDFQRVR